MLLSADARRSFIAGGVAGATEALVTQPFEVTKVRLQLGHGPPGIAKNMVDTVGRAGPSGLYYGIQAQLLQVAFKGAIRFASFEQFKALLPPGSTFTAGTLAGLTEAIVWVAPTERLKVLRQTELSGAAGTGGAGGSVFRAAAHVLQTQGLQGLWLGTGPTAARQAIANGGRFFMFDAFKKRLPDKSYSAALAGGLTGAASVVFTNPVDVIKTHIRAPAGLRTQRLLSRPPLSSRQ
jgi:solute carrier family 25 citrate transporter 1